jgi:uncharacterized protein YlxW (UPF0749 family)
MPEEEPATVPEEEPVNRPTGRERLLRSLKTPRSRGQITAAVLLAVVGFASVVQVQATEANDDYEGMREEDLVQLLNSLSSASQRAENEIAELEQTRSSLRSDTDARQAALEQARERARVLGILAGTLPTVGPGIVVTVQDPEGNVGIDQMLNGLQELRDAGAEAIELNNSVRVVAQTALEDGEEGILADGTELTPPYTIEVIGEPETLAGALNIYSGFVDDVEGPDIGGSVTIEESSNVEIATLSEPLEPEYAELVESE